MAFGTSLITRPGLLLPDRCDAVSRASNGPLISAVMLGMILLDELPPLEAGISFSGGGSEKRARTRHRDRQRPWHLQPNDQDILGYRLGRPGLRSRGGQRDRPRVQAPERRRAGWSTTRSLPRKNDCRK